MEGRDAHAHYQGLGEIYKTLTRLFPAARGEMSDVSERLGKLAKEQAARGEKPRLQVLGVGGEGAVFNDLQGRGAYKIHPGGPLEAAAGIRGIRPGTGENGTHVDTGTVPATEAALRYLRQSSLSLSSPTEIKGITENGRLITRQPLLDPHTSVSHADIDKMMGNAGGVRIQVEGRGTELRNSFAVPDGQGNWLMAIDLKPQNVLRDRATGEPKLTDGILSPITPEVLRKNPQLEKFPATKPEAQFTSRRPAAASAQPDTTPESELARKLKGGKGAPLLSTAREQMRETRQSIGQSTRNGISQVVGAMSDLPKVLRSIRETPKFSEFKRGLLKWNATLQRSALDVRQAQAEIRRQLPTGVKQEAITNWIQAKGDVAELNRRAAASRALAGKMGKGYAERLARGYEEATRLTPGEIKLAEDIKGFFAEKEKAAIAAGMFEHGRQNYVTQIWQDEGKPDESRTGTLGGKVSPEFKFAKKHLFDDYFQGEQAGMKPRTKAIGDLLGTYSSEMNKVVATRQLVHDLGHAKADDGRPLAAPMGFGQRIGKIGVGADGKELVSSHWLVRPGMTPDAKLPARLRAGKSPEQIAALEDRGDYLNINNPAFQTWKWVGEHDDAPIMLRSDFALHPDIHEHMERVLGKSKITAWYNSPGAPLNRACKLVVKGIDKANGGIKQAMLSLAPFHYVQEATHAVGHRINPLWNLPKLDFDDPFQRDAAEHGLVLAGDHHAMEQFRDGLGTGPLVYRIPLAGRFLKPINEFLFNEYIPRLKLKTYDAILRRNQHVFAGDLKDGSVSMDQVKYVSANQANAAYGHLNYTDLGRSPTVQHLLRLGLLAPDFLEARGRFVGQAVQGLVGKAGREQLLALATLGLVQYTASRIINKNLDDDYHFDHPFGVVHNGREYTMRSLPEDIYKLFQDPMRFVNGRLSPLITKTALQELQGRNWRGEKVSTVDTLAEAATSGIPISLRQAPGLRELNATAKNSPISPMESLLGSVGLHISRYSPINETYRLAEEWKKAQGIKEDTGAYPVSKFQQLRYALDDGDMNKAREEKKKLVDASTEEAVGDGFEKSINHPFTGSMASDAKFRDSLKGKDRKMYDAALARRGLIWDRFVNL